MSFGSDGAQVIRNLQVGPLFARNLHIVNLHIVSVTKYVPFRL